MAISPQSGREVTAAVAHRQHIEKTIVEAVIKGAIAAGYLVEVNDGEEDVFGPSTDPEAILKAMFTTDEDILFMHRIDEFNPKGKVQGWVKLIYGNDGWDVVSDYTVNLEPVMKEADALSAKFS